MMITTKGFWREISTGRIYAVESSPFGEILGGVGPLDENDLKELTEYEYKPNIVEWLQEAFSENRLIGINPDDTETQTSPDDS